MNKENVYGDLEVKEVERKKRTMKDVREKERKDAAAARAKKLAKGLRRVHIWVPDIEVKAAKSMGLKPRQIVYAADEQTANVAPIVITGPAKALNLSEYYTERKKKKPLLSSDEEIARDLFKIKTNGD